MDPGDGRVISNFIVQALKGKELFIFGDGSQTRSFQYVDDLIEGLIRLMNASNDLTGPVNLGNPEEISILDLANLILDLTRSKSTIAFRPLPEDDPTQRKPDINLARQKLDWTPKIGLEEGLHATIDYFKKLLKL